MEWWKTNIIYHIYLPSFKDSNKDGIGDIPGLISKLDYFKYLRVSTLLLSPFFPSPMKDNGYDISSYTDVDPKFGTMQDFDSLMQEAKERNLNIILDFVANHTSDQHLWFQKSVQREDPYTDYYIWVDPKPELTVEGQPALPNNWLSVFGGSAWTWNEHRQQFFFHQFLPEQPDLNYHNIAVREEMKKVLMFWLEKGVDGFRIDAASHLFEDTRLLDEPRAKQTKAKENEYDYLNHIYTKGLPETFKLIEEWKHVLETYENKSNKSKILLVEGMEELKDVMNYYGTVHRKLAEIPMNFQLYKITSRSNGKEVHEIIQSWLTYMPKGKYPNWVMSSHDFPRVSTRVGSKLASSLIMVMMLLPGIPICYYGDELDMQNGTVSAEETRDSFALRTTLSNSRDPMRTPMLWNRDNNAGFSEADDPWLPVNADYETKNVETQQFSPFSYLTNFKKLVKLRNEPSILCGTFVNLFAANRLFSFLRYMIGSKCFIVVLNMSPITISANLSNTGVELPETLQLELTNPEYYSHTIFKYRNSSDPSEMNDSEAHSSTSTDGADLQDLSDNPVMIPLNQISLEGHQAMVLSYKI